MKQYRGDVFCTKMSKYLKSDVPKTIEKLKTPSWFPGMLVCDIINDFIDIKGKCQIPGHTCSTSKEVSRLHSITLSLILYNSTLYTLEDLYRWNSLSYWGSI